VVKRVLKDLLFVALAKLFIKEWRISHKDRTTIFRLSPKQYGYA